MTQATTNFLTLVNNTMDESGSDLSQFTATDFLTNTDPMMNRFKKWVNRAWRDIQQESFDWEWMSEQAVVNIDPGLMFYSDTSPTWNVSTVNPMTLYDVDGTALVQNLLASGVSRLTSKYQTPKEFGTMSILYNDYSFTNQHVLDFSLKAGGEYFTSSASYTLTLSSPTGDLGLFGTPVVGDVVSYLYIEGQDGAGAVLARTPVLSTPSLEGTVTAWNTGHTLVMNLERGAETLLSSAEFILTNPLVKRAYVFAGLGPASAVTAIVSSNIVNDFSDKKFVAYATTTATTSTVPVDVCFTGSEMSVALLAAGTLVDEFHIVAPTLPDVSGYYTNAGSTVLSITPSAVDTNPRVVVTITNQDLLDALYTIASNPDQTWTINASSGIASVFEAENVLGSFPFTYLYFPTEGIVGSRNYIHSWKSYSWDEELAANDFVSPDQPFIANNSVREVNDATFRIIAHDDPQPSMEEPLKFVPWSTFDQLYDLSSAVPGTPRFITEDNMGRWRFYPPLNRPYTVLFNYVREPQNLIGPTNTPKGLPEEYIDLIMWKALIYYGEYDEQPSVRSRAITNYKNLLTRFEQMARPKFYFKSGFRNI